MTVSVAKLAEQFGTNYGDVSAKWGRHPFTCFYHGRDDSMDIPKQANGWLPHFACVEAPKARTMSTWGSASRDSLRQTPGSAGTRGV